MTTTSPYFKVAAACSLGIALLLAFEVSVRADEAGAQETAWGVSEFDGQDATSLTAAQMEAGYSLPDGQYAYTGDFATTAGHAYTADLATLATRALLADDANALEGKAASYFTNASNLTSGTLSTNRLVGSILSTEYKIYNSRLSGVTYDISITGNATTATTATSATRCTGGASTCDFE